MAVILDINHEGGTTGEWGDVSNVGDMTVIEGAALGGTVYGLNVLVDDETQDWVYSNFTKVATCRFRFYVDPNTFTTTNNTGTTAIKYIQSGDTYTNICYIGLLYLTATGFRIQFSVYDDSKTSHYFLNYDITDEPHYVEVKIVRATDAGSSDGTCEIWVDGTSRGSHTGIDNYNLMFDPASHRLMAGDLTPSAGIDGSYFLDEFILNDDGGEIGPLAGGGATVITTTTVVTDDCV